MYSTTELARLVGVSKNTILRWEQEQLIPSAMRDGRGWRVWNKATLDKIFEIKKSKEFKRTLCASKQRLRVYVIGYGNQGSVWAKNLKDSGVLVSVVLKKDSKSALKASNDGFDVINIQKALQMGDVFCLMIPDEAQKQFFLEHADYIKPSSLFIFAHGFSVGYQNILFNANKALLAPKAIAKIMRTFFLDGKTVPAVFCVQNKQDTKLLTQIAECLGLAPLIEASFFQEAVSDMFTEQILLCGGVPALLTKAFNVLKQKGIPEQIALAECLYELTYILDIVSEHGVAGMMNKISPVAVAGACKIWENIDKKQILDEMIEKAYSDIENKNFLKYLENFNKSENIKNINYITQDIDNAISKR